MKHLLPILLLVTSCGPSPETGTASNAADGPTESVDELISMARSDPGQFARLVAGDDPSDLRRAGNVVTWFAGHFDWTATDYVKRTVDEILERGGGNCNELALVTTATLEALGLRMRKVREINLHARSERRGQTARERVEERGPRMSVFGENHNDHVWIEIYDRATGSWFPADPSLGVIGEDAWIAARLGFGERFSMDPTSKDMIAPFAVFATPDDGSVLDRTRHYAIDGFDRVYGGRLGGLPSWPDWVSGIDRLADPARGAFAGTENLHGHAPEIAALVDVYGRVRGEYAAAYGTVEPPGEARR